MSPPSWGSLLTPVRSHPARLSQSTTLSSLNHTANSHWLSVLHMFSSVQFSSVAQSCPTLCNPMNHSMPGFHVHHQLLESTQTHVHRVGDAIQPSHPLSSPSPPAPNPFQHQGLFQWVNSSHEVAKVLEFQLQHTLVYIFPCHSLGLYHHLLLTPHWVHKNVLYVCISIAAPQIDLSVPSF